MTMLRSIVNPANLSRRANRESGAELSNFEKKKLGNESLSRSERVPPIAKWAAGEE